MSRSTDLPRVLVIYKKSSYQRCIRERRLNRIEELLKAGDPSVERLMEAHEDHLRTLEEAKQLFKSWKVQAHFRYRRDIETFNNYDLVVTLGGDGTLLWASHIVPEQVQIVAINTAPRDSVGYFCAGTRDNLQDTLRSAIDGGLRQTRLTRMRVELDGRVLTERVLNDILFCHRSPAATCRYLLQHNTLTEDHKSSGVWVGPAAGSTAAQRSAGGQVLPVDSEQLQYVVREAYDPAGAERRYELIKGLVDPGETLVIHSKMHDARVFLDGPHVAYDIDIGSKLTMKQSPDGLTLLGLRR